MLNGTALTLDARLASPYYLHVPTRAVALIFISLFGSSTALHVAQAFHSRLWWLFPTIVIAGLGETMGWSGRLWSSYDLLSYESFMLQTVATFLAPTVMVAVNFIILDYMVIRLGASYSRLGPRLFIIIFCTCDFVSLAIQGAGSGIALSNNRDNIASTDGVHIMLAGITFQLVILLAYTGLALEFFLRFAWDRPFTPSKQSADGLERPRVILRLKVMACALGFSTLCLFVRAIYRVVELADGWRGRVIAAELYFNVFDGAMILLAICSLNFIHPGVFLHHSRPQSHRISRSIWL